MKPDDFKKLINEISELISKQAETTETNIKAHVDKRIDDMEEHLHAEMRALEGRLATKIDTAQAEAKVDNLHLQGKLDKVLRSYKRRMDAAGLPDPDKN
jgi:hypothetical protein